MQAHEYARIIVNIYKFPFYLKSLNGETKKLVYMDAKRWLQPKNELVNVWSVFNLLLSNKNFATVYVYRFRDRKIVYKIKKFLFNPNENIEINTPKVGGGLFVPHNFGCVISAHTIGENCQVDQGVTIGNGGGKASVPGINKPSIGNNVMITTNAIVIGNINIGDNAIIGAGAVVTKDVPPNAVVVGNPQRILKIQDINMNEHK